MVRPRFAKYIVLAWIIHKHQDWGLCQNINRTKASRRVKRSLRSARTLSLYENRCLGQKMCFDTAPIIHIEQCMNNAG